MDESRSIKCGQLNLGNSLRATRELPAIADDHGLDVILVQEQHPGSLGIIETGSSPMAGVYVHTRSLPCVVLTHLSNEHCLVVALGKDNVTMASAYFQYSQDVGPHLHHLDITISATNGKRLIIGVDSNAHSPQWHSYPRHYTGRGREADLRRNLVEAFIAAHDLKIANAEGQLATFNGPAGESNIDITLHTRSAVINNWAVWDCQSASDHRLITFDVATTNQRRSPSERASLSPEPVRYRDRGVHWPGFRSAIAVRAGLLRPNASAEVLAEGYTNMIIRTADEFLGRQKPRKPNRYEWWSPQLDSLRSKHNRARRRWQDARRAGGGKEANLRMEFHRVRAEYRWKMGEAELAFFRKTADLGNQDPWGLAYRAASGRLRPPSNVLNAIKLSSGFTGTVADAMNGILRSLCPDDDNSRDTAHHRQIRILASATPSGSHTPPPTCGELGQIIRRLPNTAPGLDGISATIVKQAWRAAPMEAAFVFARCITDGIFPSIWKTGRLLVLPKCNGKPPTDPKAYRPITLLPVLGKVLERAVLNCSPFISSQISPSQHGFSPGRSTTTALLTMMRAVKDSPSKYVQAIFLDIAGAFDNAWWPMILTKLKGRGCPPNIFKVIRSYFEDRRVGLFVGDQAVWKVQTMGCPQGSVLGPSLWNVLMDDSMRLPLPSGVSIVAYADDITALIEADSRAEIERKSAATVDLLSGWGSRNRLSFSPGKSSTMTLGGRLQRPPIIKMDGTSIRSVRSATVLGVVLDSGLSFAEHATSIGERAAKCFGKMSRVSASTWGVKYRGLLAVYGGTFVPTVTYAAAVWYRRALMHVVRSPLLRTQRQSLILLTKAYRTTSTNALAVLAGVLPADLEVIRAGELEEARIRIAAEHRESCGRLQEELKQWRASTRATALRAWQRRWDTEEKGRTTYLFFPLVEQRLSWHWVEPDYELSQLLTGHGCFRKRLYDLGLGSESECFCGMEDEDLHHVLWVCPLYADIRATMLSEVVRSEVGPMYYSDLVGTPQNFGRLRSFAHVWHERRKAQEVP